LVKNIYKEIDLMILFPPCKYTSSLDSIGVPTLQLEKYKPRWNKSTLQDVIEIDGNKIRKPIEWAS
jgi:hypothetical protein